MGAFWAGNGDSKKFGILASYYGGICKQIRPYAICTQNFAIKSSTLSAKSLRMALPLGAFSPS